MCYKSQIFLGFLNLILLFILIRNAMWTRNIFFLTLWIGIIPKWRANNVDYT